MRRRGGGGVGWGRGSRLRWRRMGRMRTWVLFTGLGHVFPLLPPPIPASSLFRHTPHTFRGPRGAPPK
eukprot:2188900-Pyramimonas_sp.AAC.1